MLISALGYNWDYTNEWVLNDKVTFYYSEHSNSINEPDNLLTNIYPNPFTEYVSFSISENTDKCIFKLFDALGHQITIEEIRNNEKINLEGLPSGIYFYNLILEMKRLSGKLIKK